jgi:hypothetical protein
VGAVTDLEAVDAVRAVTDSIRTHTDSLLLPPIPDAASIWISSGAHLVQIVTLVLIPTHVLFQTIAVVPGDRVGARAGAVSLHQAVAAAAVLQAMGCTETKQGGLEFNQNYLTNH